MGDISFVYSNITSGAGTGILINNLPIELASANIAITDTNIISDTTTTIASVPIYIIDSYITFKRTNILTVNTTNNVIRMNGHSICSIGGSVTFTGTASSLFQCSNTSEIHISDTATLDSTGATISSDNFRLYHSSKLFSTASLANVSNGGNSVVNLLSDIITIPAGSLRLSLPIAINSRGQRQTQGGYKKIDSYTAIQTLNEVDNHVVLSTANITLPATASLPGLGKEYIVDTITILPGGTLTFVFDGTYYQVV